MSAGGSRRARSVSSPRSMCCSTPPTAAYIILYVLALWQNHWQVDALSSNPLIGPDAVALRSLGSKDTALIQDGRQWWRLLSSLFLTAGVALMDRALPQKLPS